MNIWEHTGRPSDEEFKQWADIDSGLSDHLAIRHECPHCGSLRTRWIRNEWHICFVCQIPFTTSEALDYMYFISEEL